VEEGRHRLLESITDTESWLNGLILILTAARARHFEPSSPALAVAIDRVWLEWDLLNLFAEASTFFDKAVETGSWERERAEARKVLAERFERLAQACNPICRSVCQDHLRRALRRKW
jgi:hypothetical protein